MTTECSDSPGQAAKPERFVSEPISPAEDSYDFANTAVGEPPLPRRFTWRKTEYTVAEVLDRRREIGPCTHGSGELYARKHWFRVRTDTSEVGIQGRVATRLTCAAHEAILVACPR